MPHSSPIAMAVAMRAVPFLPTLVARLRASGAEITSSTSRKIDCNSVAIVSDSAYGIRFGPNVESNADQTLDRAGFLQHGAHQHTEGDQQPDLGHDVAETLGDGVDRLLGAESGGQSEVGGSDDQRHRGIELEPHDHYDDREDRHSGADHYSRYKHRIRPVGSASR
jgi:hypothetical protein